MYGFILDGSESKSDAAVAARSKPQQVSTALFRLRPDADFGIECRINERPVFLVSTSHERRFQSEAAFFQHARGRNVAEKNSCGNA